MTAKGDILLLHTITRPLNPVSLKPPSTIMLLNTTYIYPQAAALATEAGAGVCTFFRSSQHFVWLCPTCTHFPHVIVFHALFLLLAAFQASFACCWVRDRYVRDPLQVASSKYRPAVGFEREILRHPVSGGNTMIPLRHE